MTKLDRLISKVSIKHIVILYILIVIGVTLQCYITSHGKASRYNNYVIFKKSFNHLVENKNLYIYYPTEHGDLFKYAPTFSFFMSIFAPFPDLPGLFLFNLLNVFMFLYGLYRLGFADDKLNLLYFFLLIETGISLSSSQTNLLIAGLIILAFACFERRNVALASLFICLTFFIKIFGIVAFVLWLLYPQKIKFVLFTVLWMVILFLIPLLIISPENLRWQYMNWLELLKEDGSASIGISLMGWMYSWFGVELPKVGTLLIGVLLLFAPFLKKNLYPLYSFRLQMLASILIWIVIFNHKGESPTYIIAMGGVGLWYFSQEKNKPNTILLWLCLIFTSCSSTEAFTPLWITSKYVVPYSIKAVFCSVIWGKLIYDILADRFVSATELPLSEKLG